VTAAAVVLATVLVLTLGAIAAADRQLRHLRPKD
jgi:hypothetical protein